MNTSNSKEEFKPPRICVVSVVYLAVDFQFHSTMT